MGVELAQPKGAAAGAAAGEQGEGSVLARLAALEAKVASLDQWIARQGQTTSKGGKARRS
jgi:hypothetical protein